MAAGESGRERPGLQLADGTRIDASAFGEDYDERFFASAGLARLCAWARSEGHRAPELSPDTRLGPPVARPSKLVCIGMNFRDHAAEGGHQIPDEPVIFLKSTTAITGANDPVRIPRNAKKLDWEVELALVIGRKAFQVPEEKALDYVLGYTIANDLSARDLGHRPGLPDNSSFKTDWIAHKNWDGSCPLGPWITLARDIPDPQKLSIVLDVNETGGRARATRHGDAAYFIATDVTSERAVEAAMAGALELSLAGPRSYHGEETEGAWMGGERREAGVADIRAALELYGRADGLFIAIVFVLAVLTVLA